AASCSQIQPINKTIGINKHGTLLSSQTTDTPGTKQNQTVPPSLRSNFSNLPELGSFSKSTYLRSAAQPDGSQPAVITRKKHAISRLFVRVGRYFSAEAAATRSTLHTTLSLDKSSYSSPLNALRTPGNPSNGGD
ncbi:hypothetical protein, partial [Arthrobacter sp. H20]|uniref:hypothetical protein n=1 Tax=Arthrobacter sp. H20 TaxID=1267981 RepID=UPI001C1E4683